MHHGRELTDKTQNAATITLAPRVIGVGEQESEDDSSSLELQRVCFLTWQLSEISILIFLTSADTKKKRERVNRVLMNMLAVVGNVTSLCNRSKTATSKSKGNGFKAWSVGVMFSSSYAALYRNVMKCIKPII